MDRFQHIEDLKKEWIGQFVRVHSNLPELKRFADIIGRVITVNCNGKAVVDFQDGAWYDITAAEDYLTKVAPAEAQDKYNPKINSAQPFPEKQGA